MAINPDAAFPGKTAGTSADYPYGEARDVTSPGDGTGTPFKALLVNDIFGFQQALLSAALITPSGDPDKVGASQYLQALNALYPSKGLGGVTYGNQGVSYALSGCAVRRDTLVGPDWAPVSDSAHIPIRVNGVTGGLNVNIQYDGTKIGTLVAGPDESFAADGTLVGASVAANNANISLGSPCSFFINFDNSNEIVFAQSMFGASRFSVSVAGTGLITITHPARRLMQMPLCQHTSGGSQFEPLIPHYINTTSPGVTALYLVGQAEGLVSYNGTSWVLSSSAWSTSDISVTYDSGTGELEFTHPTLMGSPGCAPQTWYNGELINIGMKTLTSTGFTLVLRKASDNTPPALSSALGFYFDRGMSAIRKVPAGRLNVFLGHVQVDCRQVDYQNGNFWFMAAMQQ